MTSVPDVAVCETLLNQLRSGTVACSFVQVCLPLAGSVGAAACQREEGGLLSVALTSRGEGGTSLPVWGLYQSSALSSALLYSFKYLLHPSRRWAVSTHTIAALATFPMWNWWNSLPWPLLVLTSPRALSWIPWAWIWMCITRHFCYTPFCVLGSPWIQNTTAVRNVHVFQQMDVLQHLSLGWIPQALLCWCSPLSPLGHASCRLWALLGHAASSVTPLLVPGIGWIRKN